MIEKEYYRLDELEKRFGIFEPDIQYLLERRLVNACFHIENTKFIVDSWNKSKFIGYAHLIYRGIVTIPENELAKLLHQRKITPINYLLSQSGQFELVCTDYGYEPYEDFFTEWRPKYQDEKSLPFIKAKLSPFVSKIPFHSFSKARQEAIKLENLESENGYIELENFQLPEVKLPAAFNAFNFSDICIRHADLIANNLIANKSQAKQPKPIYKTDNNIKLDNEFEDLLAAIILKSAQKLTAKKIHRILCDECDREEDSRLFDNNNILLSEDLGVITWRDKYRSNKHRSYSQTSLDNIISQVRSKLSLQKNSI